MWLPQDLQSVIIKFPDSRAKLIQLYSNDANFKSLCEDYWLSTTLRAKCGHEPNKDNALKNEYDSICSLLEQEVNDYIRKP